MSSDLEKAKEALEAARQRSFAIADPYCDAKREAERAYTRAFMAYKDAEADDKIKRHNAEAAAKAEAAAQAERDRLASLPKREFIPGKVGQAMPGQSPAAVVQAKRERVESAQAGAQADHEAQVAKKGSQPHPCENLR